jgi:hypothetical protein
MQHDKPEARCCRKRENAMAKSLKSRCCKGRCCKVDAVKVKGFPGGSFFDIGAYRFSDHTGSLFMSWGQTLLLANHGTVYTMQKLLKIKKDSHKSQKNFLKPTIWPIINRRLTRLHHAFLLAYFFDYRLLISPSADFPADHRSTTFTS